MKYVCLLRGVNVGGKSLVKMSLLKEVFENEGFLNVSTYINSGNILFESKENNTTKLTEQIESFLSKKVFPLKIVILSLTQLKKVLDNCPKNWKQKDLRKYLAFVRSNITEDEIIKESPINPLVDSIAKGPGVVYMTTKSSGLTKSGFSKLISRKVYQDITIRNYNTIEKLYTLMAT